MAWPSSGDVDTTKFDADSDKISESRPELLKMAGYVNDMIDVGPSGSYTFSTVSANGTSLVADSSSDTLTISAGTNVTITADAGTDTLTISASGSGGGTGTKIENGTSNVEIATSSGNITFASNGIEKFKINDRVATYGVIGAEFDTSISCDRLIANNLNIQPGANDSGIAAQFAGNVEVSSGTISGSLTGAVTASTLTVPYNTASITNGVTGSVGQVRAISDQGGKLAYWDTTNSRWSYVHDNSAV